MVEKYDAIIVGARCAGAPTAMLLARKGYRALVVDRASFPSDTISTHILWPLIAWGDSPTHHHFRVMPFWSESDSPTRS